jgi:type I restriction enzyme S subunit
MAGWKSQTLAEACQFINGLWKGEEPPFVHVGVIRNTNFTKEGKLDDSDIAYLDVEAKKFAKRRLEYGDLILEKSGGGPKQPVGRVIFFDKMHGDFSFSNFTAAIRVIDPGTLYPRYLHRYLHWFYLAGNTEAMQSHSTGIRNLNGDAYKAIRVAYPPLPEQRRIVAVLNEAFEAISTAKANTEKSLQNAREVFSSALAELFPSNTESVSLAELSVSISDGDHSPPPKAASGVPFITISNVDKETREIDFTSTFTVPREYFDNLKSQRRPQPGDVLYTVTGSFGIPILVEGDREFCFQRHIGLIRPKSNVDSRWLMYGLLSPMSFAQADAGATGTAQRTVSLGVLRGLRLPRVSSEAQCLDADRLDALDTDVSRLKGIAKAKIAALAELKKSLLHQAFTGQL